MTKYYDVESIPRGEPGSSHSVMLDLVGPDRRVLDVGSATGYLARSLVEQGCVVSGIDNDPEAVEKSRDVLAKAVVADLDAADLADEFGSASQDVVVFGDVLEHLRAPGTLLRQARQVLAPGGYLVISIPNVAHGDVRLALFGGEWTYRPLGLLDDTHIRFFTEQTFRRLLLESGFAVTELHQIRVPLFGSELGVREAAFPPEVVAAVRSQPDHDVYQLVMRAVPADADGAVAVLAGREQELRRQVESLEGQLAALRHEVAALRVRSELADDAAAQLASARVDLARERVRAAELDHLRDTRLLRWSAAPRRAYGSMRRLRP